MILMIHCVTRLHIIYYLSFGFVLIHALHDEYGWRLNEHVFDCLELGQEKRRQQK